MRTPITPPGTPRPQHPQQLHPLAIAWVAAQGADIVPLVGARTRERLTEALPATEITLTADDLAAVEKAVPAGSARGDRYPPALTATPGVANRVDRAR